MTVLAIAVTDARPAPQIGAPAITFRLYVEDLLGGRVHAVVLRCQVRIEPRRRRYTDAEQERLYELFGDPAQWDRTLQAVTWSHTSLVVPGFERRAEVDLTVPCTYDLEVASAKYLHAVRDGDIPLVFLFSGTIFRAGDAGAARGVVETGSFIVEPVSWDLEATFRMPSAVWRATMDQFFPGGGWLRLQRETIDRLQAFRGQQAVVTWDEAIDLLLQASTPRQPV